MIYDRIENLDIYFNDCKLFNKIEGVIADFIKAPFDSGRIDIDGDNMWCNVAKYNIESKDEIKYESHRKYVDVQVMIDGEEIIGYSNINDCTITENFKPDNDIAFMTSESGVMMPLRKGYFMALYPEDAHAPCLKSGNSDFAHKLVFKVKL